MLTDPYKEKWSRMYNYLLYSILTLCLSIQDVTANHPPVLTKDMNLQVVSETAAPGTIIYTLEATDPEGSPVTYGLTGSPNLSVNPRTGEVTVVKPLDREEKDTLRLEVTVEDQVPGSTNNVVRVPISLIVLDENDNEPVFTRNTYNLEVAENAELGSVILANLMVTDRDQVGDVLQVECKPLNNQDLDNSGCDVINIISELDSSEKYVGRLVLKKPLSYKATSEYMFRLVGSDGIHMVSAPAKITVKDIQNSPPVFSGSLTGVVSEDDPIGTLVMTVRANDGDVGASRPVQYSLISNPLDFFRIHPDSGELRTAKPLDREALSSSDGVVALVVKAMETENGNPVGSPDSEQTVTLNITIRDVNDEPPTFNQRDYRVSIPENVPNGTPLPNLNMIVKDTDVGSNSLFSLRLIDSSGMFSVEPDVASGSTSVSLRVAKDNLDYENPNQRKFILLVVADERLTDPRLSSTATVHVSVVDTNDNSPIFEQEAYTAFVSEIASGGTVVTTINAVDRDTGDFGTEGIRYSLVGNGAEKFDVDEISGTVRVARCTTPGSGNCLDHEKNHKYFLSFRATDNKGTGHGSVVPVRIIITDSNDNPPHFNLPKVRAVINEAAPDFDPPLFVMATDPDSTSEITYSIVAGDPSGLFQIDKKTGHITLTNPKGLDITSVENDVIILTVEASDGTGSHTVNVEISIKDVNNNKPIFSEKVYAASVQENAPPGTLVDELKANDADTGLNAMIMYRIQSGGFDDFTIDNTTGKVIVGRKLDYDRRKEYNLSVVAIDGGTPKFTSTAMLTVTVINNNDKSPYFTPTTQRTQVREDAEIGYMFYQLLAEDPDVNEETGLRYEITGVKAAVNQDGKPLEDQQLLELQNTFTVDKSTGNITVANKLDRSVATEVTLQISVQDISADPPQIGTGNLVITLVDVNDFPPMFPAPWSPDSPVLTVSIPEEMPLGSLVTTITATDVDSNIGGYKALTPSDHFEIDAATGVVTLTGRMDYEERPEYNLTVLAWDTGLPRLSASATVIVKLKNINDEEPVFTQQLYEAKLEENSPVGTSVIMVSAHDADAGELGNVNYKLSGHNSQFFMIDETGLISVKDNSILDREALKTVNLRIVATDSTPFEDARQTSVPLTITITDTNDHTPAFSQALYKVSVVENIPLNPPAPIVQVTAHDNDDGINAAIYYEITSGNEQGLFYLDGVTGILYPANPLKASDKKQAYSLTVEARDVNGTGPYTDKTNIEITILPQNQHKPRFINPILPNATVTVPENLTSAVIEVLTLQAQDEDEGSNGDVRYHFRVGDKNIQETEEFELDPVTGVLTTKVILDREVTAKYELVIVAKDQGSPISYETLRFLTVLIEDINDNRPEFPKMGPHQSYKFAIVENMPKNSLVGKIQAKDLDAGINAQVNYYIISGNTNTSFSIDKLNGNIYTNTILDRELQGDYSLVVKATNDPNFIHPGEEELVYDKTDPTVALVYINIEDVNDNAPEFGREYYYAGVSHTAEVDRFIRMVPAFDKDNGMNGTITYFIRASNLYRPGETKAIGSIIPSPFNITQEGKLMTASLMSQYRKHRFVLEIHAKEEAPPHRVAKCKVNVWVWEREELVRVVLSQPPEHVVGHQEEVVSLISSVTNGIAVVDEIRYHIDGENNVNRKWTDMLVHVVNKSEQVMPIPQVLHKLDLGYLALTAKSNNFVIEDVYPAYIGVTEDEIDARLAGLIALSIVLFMGVISFFVVCCCLRFWVLSPAGRSREQLIKRSLDEDLGLNTTENPLWVDQKLKTYEEQELTMQVMSEFDAINSSLGNNPNNDQNNVTVDAEWSPERNSNLEFQQMDTQSNTYATIQKSHGGTLRSIQLRNLQQSGTMALTDPAMMETNDYATLDHLRKPQGSQGPKVPGIETPMTAFAHDPESAEYHELCTSFTGSTFQPPDTSNLANRPLPEEPVEGRKISSGSGSSSGRQLTLNAQGEPVLIAELI